VTVEDDTGGIEMLAFYNVLNQYGAYLRENSPVVIVGRLSLRDDKEPQMVINRVRPISDYADSLTQQEAAAEAPPVAKPLYGTLYLRLTSQSDPRCRKIKAIIKMFPGDGTVVLYFADTKTRMGSRCALDPRMLRELKTVLGEENVVLK